jgi:hypothetical protein
MLASGASPAPLRILAPILPYLPYVVEVGKSESANKMLDSLWSQQVSLSTSARLASRCSSVVEHRFRKAAVKSSTLFTGSPFIL